jgi:hypothetical protein
MRKLVRDYEGMIMFRMAYVNLEDTNWVFVE